MFLLSAAVGVHPALRLRQKAVKRVRRAAGTRTRYWTVEELLLLKRNKPVKSAT